MPSRLRILSNIVLQNTFLRPRRTVTLATNTYWTKKNVASGLIFQKDKNVHICLVKTVDYLQCEVQQEVTGHLAGGGGGVGGHP